MWIGFSYAFGASTTKLSTTSKSSVRLVAKRMARDKRKMLLWIIDWNNEWDIV
ncbi:hypothetical protein C2W64_01711 [Brevibacillus laterosporus]|nr:hypothetical protein [Brevibacillus laterosporus]RAP30515.1 hypothetical protein C2W64_01711 [Brevibacillus laterosporus]